MATQTHRAFTLNGDNFEQEVLKSEQTVLVDFWAEWCSPCRALGPVVEEIAADFEGRARVAKVDVDQNKSLAAQYAINSIPTLLFFRDGEVVDRIQGVVSKSELAVKLTALADGKSADN